MCKELSKSRSIVSLHIRTEHRYAGQHGITEEGALYIVKMKQLEELELGSHMKLIQTTRQPRLQKRIEPSSTVSAI